MHKLVLHKIKKEYFGPSILYFQYFENSIWYLVFQILKMKYFVFCISTTVHSVFYPALIVSTTLRRSLAWKLDQRRCPPTSA